MAIEHIAIVVLSFIIIALVLYIQVKEVKHSANRAEELALKLYEAVQEVRIQQEAIKNSTHTVIPVGGEAQTKKLEEQFKKVMGIGDEDFEYDLQKQGFSDSNVEDLV